MVSTPLKNIWNHHLDKFSSWTLLFLVGHHFSASSHGGGCHLDRLVGTIPGPLKFRRVTVHPWNRPTVNAQKGGILIRSQPLSFRVGTLSFSVGTLSFREGQLQPFQGGSTSTIPSYADSQPKRGVSMPGVKGKFMGSIRQVLLGPR